MITTIKEFKKIVEGFSSSHFTEIKDVIAKLGYKIDDIQPEDGDVGIFDGWVVFLDNDDNFYSVNYNDFNYELFETRNLPEEERLQHLQNFIDQRKEVVEESNSVTHHAIKENNEKNIELIFHLDSPYKWGKGWTASPEQKDLLNMEAMKICNNLHFSSDIGKYGVVEGKPKDPNSNMYNAYMHPMEFVFKLKQYNQTDIELIKGNVEDGISNLNEHFPISIKEIRLNNKGEYSTITESYKLGAKYSSDFDYDGMLKVGANIRIKDGINKLQKLYNSFEDVNYHTEAKPLYKAIQYLKSNHIKPAKLNLEIFNQLCKEELVNISENANNSNKNYNGYIYYEDEDGYKHLVKKYPTYMGAKKMFNNLHTTGFFNDYVGGGLMSKKSWEREKQIGFVKENVDTEIPALPVDVYRNKRGGATNGITAQKDDLMLVFDGLNSPFKVEDGEDYLVLQTKSFRGKEYKYAVPKSILDSGKHSMFGGNFVYSSDARFPSDAPIKVHDRVE